MQKNKFISATLILMISGFITKILGFIIRVIYTRSVGVSGIALYSLVMPTYSLLTTLAVLAMPFAISKCVAENVISNKKILSSALLILLVVNFSLVLFVIIFSKYIAINLLNEAKLVEILITCSLSLPFVSISSIIKGYYFGKQKMLPNAISNVMEQVIKILLIVMFLPMFINNGIISGIKFLFISNIICEICSVIILIMFLPRSCKFKIFKPTPSLGVSRDLMAISLPTVTGRILGNIGYFFEPIILTNILILIGMSKSFIVEEYGVYNAYSISLLLMPSFFINAVSQSLLPEISKFYSERKYKLVLKRLKQALAFSLGIGLFFTGLIFIFKEALLTILYNTTRGSEYISILAPFFVLFYLEAPISSFLVAINKVKLTTFITVLGVFIKLLFLTIFCYLGFGIYSLVYAEIINIVVVVILSVMAIKKFVNHEL